LKTYHVPEVKRRMQFHLLL